MYDPDATHLKQHSSSRSSIGGTETILESLNGGLANGGLRYLSTIAYDCRHFTRKIPLRKWPKRATKVHNCRRLCANAESGLKPPFESPHLDFPECMALIVQKGSCECSFELGTSKSFLVLDSNPPKSRTWLFVLLPMP